LKFLSYWLYKQTAAVLHPILFQLPISNNESCCTERFFEINLMKKFEREASIRYLKKEYLFEKQMNTWKRPVVYVLCFAIEAIQLSLFENIEQRASNKICFFIYHCFVQTLFILLTLVYFFQPLRFENA
jgi:hypothetical protein